MRYSKADEEAIMNQVLSPRIRDDPYAFVMWAFPWGEKGTPLEHFTGPREWQKEELIAIGEHIKAQRLAPNPTMWRQATSSGRGVGKSALVAWESLWMASTRIGSTTIVTANNEPQLKSRTFAEITKWVTLAINGHWFDTTVLSVRPATWFKHLVETQLKIDCGYYYIQGQLWTEENPDAFAGVHNPLGVKVVFDEASGVPQAIFSVTEGFFTEPIVDRYWDIFSNPRRNSGGFFDCFNDHKEFWRLRNLDSRTVEGTDKQFFERMIKQYGIDSDTVRIEVLGQFPKQGDRQFIANNLVKEAQERELIPDNGAPLVLGIDIARYGNDATVLRWRQGRDARTIPPVRFKERDNVFVAQRIAEWIDLTHPDAVNIDAGNGTGVIDLLRAMKYRVNEVWFGGSSTSHEWANKRTEMYAEIRNWLPGGCLDEDANLFRDLTSPEYDFFGKARDSLMLESKESMKSRGLTSPDDGDALACTFAFKVARRDIRASTTNLRTRQVKGLDYSLFGD